MLVDNLYIIAEIGINANGDIETAKKLIHMAKECGCDAAKFQKRTIDVVYTPEFLTSYRESPWGTTQRAQKEGLEFGKERYDEIDRHCNWIGIKWSASTWDIESQHFLRHYNVAFNKIASPMLTHIPLITEIASEQKMTFISTGMSTHEQIETALEIFKEAGCPYTLMHTVSIYPCKNEDCNILMIPVLKDKYECPVGYSGHETGLVPSALAVAFGAVAIERHITLDRTGYGSDQPASLERHGLELLVRDCREVKAILGDGVKKILPVELKTEKSLRYFL